MFTIRQKIVNELKSEINRRTFEVGVFWSEGAYNKSISSCHVFTSCYKHFLSSCIHICLSCIDICFNLYWHLFSSCNLQVVTRCIYKLLHVVFTSCYNVLQVHVSTRSEMTYQHVRKWRSAPQKGARKWYYILLPSHLFSWELSWKPISVVFPESRPFRKWYLQDHAARPPLSHSELLWLLSVFTINLAIINTILFAHDNCEICNKKIKKKTAR